MPPSRKGVPPSPKASPHPPTEWGHPNDDCLHLIFAHLPQADLRRVALVCHQWAIVQRSAYKRTKELAVFIGKEADDLLSGEAAFPSHNLDSFKRKVAFSRIDLPDLKQATVKQLLCSFPNVTRLYLFAGEIERKQASRLVDILKGLSSTLVKLHLAVTFTPRTDYVTESAAGLELLRAVNGLPHLKVLTFDLDAFLENDDDDETATSTEKHLSLPSLAHLHELNFKSRDDAKDLVESFSKFASGNGSLVTIRLASQTPDASSWGLYLQLNGRLLSTFKYLKVEWDVREYENPPFSRLFPLLTSLTHLEFGIYGEAQGETQYRDTVAALATLKSLQVLKLVLATNLNPRLRAVPVGLLQLATVRELSLELFSDSHKERLLRPCYLEWVFPRLEEVNIHFTIRDCEDCFFRRETITLQEAKLCANKLYGRQVKNLKKLRSVKKKLVTFSWERHFPDERRSITELAMND